jgi:hypothetical protein
MPIVAPGAAQIAWKDIRKAVAAIIRAASPNARVHDNWKLFFDLGKTTSGLIVVAENPEKGKIHSWMIQVNNATVPRNPSGDVPFVGGGRWDWSLQLDVWGFYDYALSSTASSSQDIFETELELVGAYFQANPMLDESLGLGLRNVFPLEFAPIELAGFADGRDAHVAQGRMRIDVARTLV